MANHFHHENLRVYQKAIAFVADAHEILRAIPDKAAAKDQLKRASESIPANIAGGNAQRSPDEQKRFVDVAIGSAAECAACMDVLATKRLCSEERSSAAKKRLLDISKMLFGFRRSKDQRCLEDPAEFGDSIFAHEKLEAYSVALEAVGWNHRFSNTSSLEESSRDSLDRYTTSLILNIAEGNVKWSVKERGKFFDIAIAAALRAASGLDIIIAKGQAESKDISDGKEILARSVSLVLGLQKRISK